MLQRMSDTLVCRQGNSGFKEPLNECPIRVQLVVTIRHGATSWRRVTQVPDVLRPMSGLPSV